MEVREQEDEQQEVNVEQRTLDLQDMLVDALGQASLLREKQRLSHKAIQLLKKKASMLTSVSNLGAAKLQEERTELERQLQRDLAAKECQVMAARADVDQWKRRTGLLQLRLSSIQEDADMYRMRCQLLQSEATRESIARQEAQGELASRKEQLCEIQKQLLEVQGKEQELQATLTDMKSQQAPLDEALKAKMADLHVAKAAAASAAQLADQRLARAQEELAEVKEQIRQAAQNAEAASKKAENLEWKLRMQEATLAERSRVADEAKQLTTGLSEEGIKAVREKASFLEAELRAQLEDARGFLADERRQRRAAEAAVAELEAGLNKRLEAAKAEIASLQAQVRMKESRIAALEEACSEQQTQAALDVVSSLVGDLNPPDTEPRKRPDQATARLPTSLEPVPEAQLPAADKAAHEEDISAAAQKGDGPGAAGKKSRGKMKQADATQQIETPAKDSGEGQGRKRKAAMLAGRAAKLGNAAESEAVTMPAQVAEAAPAPVDAETGHRGAVHEWPSRTPPDSEAAAKAPTKVDKTSADAKPPAQPKKKAGRAAKSSATGDVTAGATAQESGPIHGSPPGRARSVRARASNGPWWMGGAAGKLDQAMTFNERSGKEQQPTEEPEAAPKKHRRKHAAIDEGDYEADGQTDAAQDAQADAQMAADAAGKDAGSDAAATDENAEEKAQPAGRARSKQRKPKAATTAANAQATATATLPVAAEEAAAAPEEAAEKPAAKQRRRLTKAEPVLATGSTPLDEVMEDPDESATTYAGVPENGTAQEPRQSAVDRLPAANAQPPVEAASNAGAVQQGEPVQPSGEQGPDSSAGQAAEPDQVAQQEEPDQEAQEGHGAVWERGGRPSGVSKIDLTAVWGANATPQPGPSTTDSETAATQKENGGFVEKPAILKPVPGRSRFGSQSEANPLAALTTGVLGAALKAHGSYVSGLNAPKRGPEAAPGKRRLLPAQKPIGQLTALPTSILFGQNFQVPKLSRN